MVVGSINAQAANTPEKLNENNNRVNGLDGVRLRNGGATKLSANGSLGLKRELSPVRDVIPDALHDRLKTASNAVQSAQTTLDGLEKVLRSTIRDTRPSRLELESTLPSEWLAKERRRTEGGSREKEFKVRNSPLTDLFSVQHIATLYHITIVVVTVLLLNCLIKDIATTGSINLSIDLIWFCFGGFHRVITIWLVMFFSTNLLYAAFCQWAHRRRTLRVGSVSLLAWDYGCLCALLLYYAAFLVLPTVRMLHYSLPVASSFALLTEQVRLSMKSYAFVRSNAPRALSASHIDPNDSKKASTEVVCPGFSQFLYFMFAPTLIYRDSYPRTAVIRWSVVAGHLAEVLGVVFYLTVLCDRFMLPAFRDFGTRPLSLVDAAAMVISAVLPAGFCYVCSFYLLLHSWQNAFAEMLRFGDRLFYKDWWNQSSFPAFYRTWNVLVQDWLHAYVYRDVQNLGGSGVAARITVFVVSAVAHEYILAFGCGFFYPMLYLLFGVVGMLLTFITYNHSRAIGNVGLWMSLFLGDGLLFGLYACEYYARVNCPRTIDSAWDYFVPRSWACDVHNASAVSAV